MIDTITGKELEIAISVADLQMCRGEVAYVAQESATYRRIGVGAWHKDVIAAVVEPAVVAPVIVEEPKVESAPEPVVEVEVPVVKVEEPVVETVETVVEIPEPIVEEPKVEAPVKQEPVKGKNKPFFGKKR